ncbi:MAG: DEAD/DEAH box helicase family protein [Alphaproteobacteria bacterium]|nr:DEAD/DEAH box helicase family protein [Alphaproteobacteria bacterium]
MNLGAGPGVAVREFQTQSGPCDYLLFAQGKPVGVIEAKPAGTVLTGIEAQTKAYAESLPDWLKPPVSPLPFLYESSGEETRFTNGLDPIPRSRRVFQFHQPATLHGWAQEQVTIDRGLPGAPTAPTFYGRMTKAPPLVETGMWPAQIAAVTNLEASIQKGRRRALIQMATGSGKTFTAISALYRLIKHGGARRVLFLVDRGNLGRQALKEFQAYTTPDDGRKFTELYNVARLTSNKVDPVNRVVITTIQRLYAMLRDDPDFADDLEEGSAFTGSGAALLREPPPVVYNPKLPPEFFDVIVVDECHRSIYTLWRQVLEYFDASLIGLTATPAKHTFGFFEKNVVSEYRHEHAVRDHVNVPFEVYEIRTRITEGGADLLADDETFVGKRDRQTRSVRWEALDEDLSYAANALDRSVVAKDQIRTVIREFKDKLFTRIFPGRTEVPKTLIFAKNDAHAEDVLDIVRQEFGYGNEEAVKVTYKPEKDATQPGSTSASRKPEDVIQAFRNSYQPRIAVTVDMIATGTDIKPLECVMFMRSVKSRALFEQMKGRGVRVIADADFQAVTPDAKTKTHFVIVDAVGVMDEQKSDPPIIRDRGLSLKKLLEMVAAGNRDEDILSTLAGRLDRMDRQLTPEQREEVEAASDGQPLQAIVAGFMNALDPDVEYAKARELYQLPADVKPSGAQLKVAQEELREPAAQPIAHNPGLRGVLLEIRRQQEQIIDDTTIDKVTKSGARPEHKLDVDKLLVQDFEAFIAEHRDEIDALQILYARPYGDRLTREQIRQLAHAIEKPPRAWATDRLWAAYEKVEQGRVKGSSSGRLWTDIVALARHALHPKEDIVPFADQVQARFDNWLAQQGNKGRTFTGEQVRWLEMIRDRIASDVEMRKDDLEDVPFVQEGGLGRAFQLFGSELDGIVAELNEELVA